MIKYNATNVHKVTSQGIILVVTHPIICVDLVKADARGILALRL